ncbi:MAG: hypothetical protein ACHQZR_00490 [Candidatus Limnocylindrales bacterium]
MAKYDALRDLLAASPRPVDVTMDEIARRVGGLPPSARRRREWWVNNVTGHVQARAWLEGGRRVEAVDLDRGVVRFS